MVAGPFDPRARSHAHMLASDADREHVVEVLKTAFVQGRLTIDELRLRAGLALASRTYAELGVTIADIPAPRLKPPPPPRSVRPAAQASADPPVAPVGRMPAGAKAAVWAAFLTYYGGFLVIFLIAFTGLTVTIGTTVDKKAAG